MTNIFQALIAQTDWALLVFRLALGVIFIAHGFSKLKNFGETVAWLGGDGFKPGWLWATLVTVAEFIGGLFILAGFLTQPAALVLVVSMMTAFAYNFRKKAPFFHHLELDIILIAALLLLATLGGGSFSVSKFFGVGF